MTADTDAASTIDPDDNLAEQLTLAEQLLSEYDQRMVAVQDARPDPHDVARLCEHVLDLHEHIQAGGRLPAAWENAKP